MSKITNPITEESVSCGFFNSAYDASTGKYDRTYKSEDFGSLFDGLITDGIFETIGDCFAVTVNEGNTVTVGTGKAWFNKVWVVNDGSLSVYCGESSSTYSRYDAIVIRIDHNETVKDAFIQVVHGDEEGSPARPAMVDTEYEHWYPICYIYRPKNSKDISVYDIQDVRGSSTTPYVTGIPQTRLPAETLTAWREELDAFIAQEKSDMGDFTEKQRAEYNRLFTELQGLMTDVANELVDWTDDQETFIDDWFEGIKRKLGTDPATALQLQLDEIEIKRILANGFIDGTKKASEDGRTITSQNSTETLRLLKVFSEDFLTITTILIDNTTDVEIGRMTKEISSDGGTIISAVALNY